MAAPVSVIVLTKNEELAIEACLASVTASGTAFDEVFVVDSGSTDRTVELAEKLGATVVQFAWNGQYPKKKQWALERVPCRNDWVLMLDADEVVTPELAAEIAGLDLDGPVAAYDVSLDYVFLGRRLRHGHKVTKRVLLRRDRNRFPVVDDLGATNMWEVEGHYQPVTDGAVGRLRSSLRHEDREPLFHYFERHNRYSDWEAHLAATERKDVARARSRQGQLFDRVPFKPLAFFVYSYLVRGGWRDGAAGFHYAVAHAFYFWQISVKRRERAAA